MFRLMVRSLAVMAVVTLGSTLAGPILLDEAAAHRESGAVHALAPTEVIIDQADGSVSTGVFALAVMEIEPCRRRLAGR